MRDELQLTDEERHSHFHGNDDLISVEELWQSWIQSDGQLSFSISRSEIHQGTGASFKILTNR